MSRVVRVMMVARHNVTKGLFTRLSKMKCMLHAMLYLLNKWGG